MQVINKSEQVKAWVANAPRDFRDMVLKIHAAGQGAAQEIEIAATVNMTADEFTRMAAQFQAPNEMLRGHQIVKINAQNFPVAFIAVIGTDGAAEKIGFEIEES